MRGFHGVPATGRHICRVIKGLIAHGGFFGAHSVDMPQGLSLALGRMEGYQNRVGLQ
jgi:hypothetical protein